MKVQADKKVHRAHLQCGDSVFVKLQTYVQMLIEKRSNHKLLFCYIGPYKILHATNPIAYEQELPTNSKVHLVFRVSQLCQALAHVIIVAMDLLTPNDEQMVPIEILNSRWHHTPIGRYEQILA